MALNAIGGSAGGGALTGLTGQQGQGQHPHLTQQQRQEARELKQQDGVSWQQAVQQVLSNPTGQAGSNPTGAASSILGGAGGAQATPGGPLLTGETQAPQGL